MRAILSILGIVFLFLGLLLIVSVKTTVFAGTPIHYVINDNVSLLKNKWNSYQTNKEIEKTNKAYQLEMQKKDKESAERNEIAQKTLQAFLNAETSGNTEKANKYLIHGYGNIRENIDFNSLKGLTIHVTANYPNEDGTAFQANFGFKERYLTGSAMFQKQGKKWKMTSFEIHTNQGD